MKNYPQSSVILGLTLDWLLTVSAHTVAREVLAKEEIMKAIVDALQTCSFNRTIVDDSCLIFANLSDIEDAVRAMNKLDVLSIVEEMNKKNGSAKTDSAVIELKKVLKKSHHHRRHHRSEKTEGEDGEEKKRHRSHRHHSHRSRSKRAEGGDGTEGKKHRRHHHSRRSEKPVVEPQVVVEGENPSEDVQQL